MAIIWDDEKPKASGGIVWDDEQPKRLSASQRTEQLIGNRPSPLASLLSNPLGAALDIGKRNLMSGRGLGGLPMDIAQGLFPAAAEAVESVPANVGLAAQRGSFRGLGPQLLQGISGQRPAQLGDIIRASGLPEPIANALAPAIGLAATAGIGGRPSARAASEAVGVGTQAIKAPFRTIRKPLTEAQKIAKLNPVEREATFLQKRRGIEDVRASSMKGIAAESESSAQRLEGRKQRIESALLKRQRTIEDLSKQSQAQSQKKAAIRKAKLDKDLADIETQLQRKGHETVVAVREKFGSVARAQSKAYSEPIDAALNDTQGGSLPPAGERIILNRARITEKLEQRIQNRPDEVQEIINSVFPEGVDDINGFEAKKRIDDFSREISKTAKTGGGFSWRDKRLQDAIGILLDEMDASDELAARPNVGKTIRQKKAEWASYAQKRDKLNRLMRLYQRDPIETERGSAYLVNAAKKGKPGTVEFIQRIENLMEMDLSSEFKTLVEQMPDPKRLQAAIQIRNALAKQAETAAKRSSEDTKVRLLGKIAQRKESIQAKAAGAKQQVAKQTQESKRKLEDLSLDVDRQLARRNIIKRILSTFARVVGLSPAVPYGIGRVIRR